MKLLINMNNIKERKEKERKREKKEEEREREREIHQKGRFAVIIYWLNITNQDVPHHGAKKQSHEHYRTHPHAYEGYERPL